MNAKTVADAAASSLGRPRSSRITTARRRTAVLASITAAVTLAVAGCSSSGGGSGTSSVSLVTGVKSIIGADLPFVVAKEKGYYKDAGLNVNIIFGDGYDTAVRLVGAGKADYAETDLASITGAVDQSLPVKSVAVYSQISPAGLVFHSSKPINTPADIKGMKIATSAGSGSGKVFDAWLKANSISGSSFTRVVVPGHQKPIVFAQNRVDAYVGLGSDDLPDARKTAGGSSKVGFYYFAKDNIRVPGVAIAAAKSEISGHSDRVRKFLAATKKGYDSAKADIAGAVKLAHQLQPTSDPQLLTEQWKIFIEAEKGAAATTWGNQSAEGWKQTVSVFGGATSRPLSDYYTNAYLPSGK